MKKGKLKQGRDGRRHSRAGEGRKTQQNKEGELKCRREKREAVEVQNWKRREWKSLEIKRKTTNQNGAFWFVFEILQF